MTSPANLQQIEYWNGPAGERWAKAQDRIDHHFGLITEVLLREAALREGERVLDVGCGGGSLTLLLRERVGPSGAVTGIDVSSPNLALAQAKAHAAMADVSFIKADAAVYDFQPVFDVVFSRFGVMFFDDPVLAFTNIRRALQKQGRLVFVCWRSMQENDWARVPFEAAYDLLPPQEPPIPHAPGPFAFADGERVTQILTAAGFGIVSVKPHDLTMNMGATIEDAVAEAMTIGPLARASAELDEDTRTKIRARVAPALEPFRTAYGITPPAAIWSVTASR